MAVPTHFRNEVLRLLGYEPPGFGAFPPTGFGGPVTHSHSPLCAISPAARDLARDILSSPGPSIMLVQSAAAVLARLGTKDDLALLQSLATSADRHTAPALKNAIQSIQSKN